MHVFIAAIASLTWEASHHPSTRTKHSRHSTHARTTKDVQNRGHRFGQRCREPARPQLPAPKASRSNARKTEPLSSRRTPGSKCPRQRGQGPVTVRQHAQSRYTLCLRADTSRAALLPALCSPFFRTASTMQATDSTQEQKPSCEVSARSAASSHGEMAASNALERVFTTRSIVDPGPPPDGGWKAWSQVCCGWMVLFCTWGWINRHAPSHPPRSPR